MIGRLVVLTAAALLGVSQPALAQAVFADSLEAAPMGGSGGLTFYYFTCKYFAYHFDDYGPLGISVSVSAYAPDGTLLASEVGSDGGGYLSMAVVATVPLRELSSGNYSCRSTPLNPPEPERVTEGKIACEDSRNDILREYGQFDVPTVPFCSDFSQSGGTSHFSWADWTQDAGGHGWAIGKIWSELETWYTNYGRGEFRVTSGFRCPHRNNAANGASDSRHMSGEAIDVYSRDQPWTPEEFSRMKSAAISAGAVFVLNWDSYDDHHLHAQWR